MQLLGDKVQIIEKREHIAGNLYDYKDHNGVLVSRYGAHLFHTNDKLVWRFVSQFSDWVPYEHRVVATLDDQIVPLPVNIDTVNMLLGEKISSRSEMQIWLKKHQIKGDKPPQNGEEAAIGRVGLQLYKKLFESYTKKQWELSPSQLDASVLERIPVRDDWDDR